MCSKNFTQMEVLCHFPAHLPGGEMVHHLPTLAKEGGLKEHTGSWGLSALDKTDISLLAWMLVELPAMSQITIMSSQTFRIFIEKLGYVLGTWYTY